MLDIVLTKYEIDKAFVNSNQDNFFVGVKASTEIFTSSGKTERYTFIYDSLELPWRNSDNQA